ncbi:MAG: InlB B-repeat-containing protein, partial [Bacilli bacterium]|nr:InlB B-repeat-containing protein [Bacilli bacterium]
TFTENFGTLKVLSESERRGYNFLRYDHDGGGTYNNLTYLFDNDDATLTAIYEIINYRINYENITTEERDFLRNKTTYNVETETFTLSNPNTRVDGQGNNYQDFLGWDDGNGNVSLTVTISKGSIGDRTYTAVWRENQDDYAIRYNLHEGTLEAGKSNPNTYTRQTETFTLNNPSKNGYNFIGWTGTGLTVATETVTIPKGSSGDRDYEANYEVVPYEIHYHGLTSVEEATLGNPDGYNIESASITLHNPTREGYEFLGWSGTDITDKSTSVTIPTGSTGERNYTANFKAIEYSLTYTLNGGDYETGKSNPPTYTIESDPIILNNPSKTGYTFKGWFGTDLTGNENTTVTIPTGSIGHRSFLANYTPITYTITYDYDGGNLPQGVTNIDRYTIESAEITFNAPEKDGYTFLHYKEGNNIITSIPTGSTGDKSLKAYYQINKFNVVYHNEDIVYATDEVDWNDKTSAPSENPTKAHGIFLYWSEDGINPFDFETKITSNKDLYAIYEMVIEPVITYTPVLDETTNRTWVCSNSNDDNCGDTVTITSGKDDSTYTLYYKIGDGTAVEYTGPFKVYENTTITTFAKKSDIYSPNTTEDIVNVDSIAPTINNPGTGAMSFNMSISGTAQDAGSGVKQFILYVKEKDALVYDDTFTYTSNVFDGIKDHAENYDHTFYGVQDNTEYIVKIVAEDYVGNISEKEVEVKTNPYVARVVGKNNMLWYTVDPDTKEFVLEDGKEFLLFDSIQSAVDYCADVECTIQTNPILPVVSESVVIGSEQNITIDLDGRGITSDESATFVNNGELHIVDRNPREINGEHESIGFLSNTVNKAIVNNNVLVVGEGSSEASETFIYPEMDRPIIDGKTNAIEQNGTFYFFDGKIYGDTVALLDSGEDPITQYSYNVVLTGENDRNVGYLDKVTDPEARIRSTYYAKLKVNNNINAFDSSRSGTVTTESAKILSKIKQYTDYGFIYDEVNDEIYNGNQSTANTTAISYIKLDLTDYEQDQFLSIDCIADTISSSSYGYISVGESLNNTGNRIITLYGNDKTYSTIHKLEKGKVYYVYFGFVKGGGDINRYEGFKVSNFSILGDGQPNREFKMYEDPGYYMFVKQDDGTYIQESYGQSGNPTAHGFTAFDLTNENEDVDLILNIRVDSSSSASRFWIYTSDNSNYVGYGSSPNQIMGTAYGLSDNSLYRITLPKGKLTYVHFCASTWYQPAGLFKINSMTLTKKNSENAVASSGFLTNDSDAYTFVKYDYDLYSMKNLAANDIPVNATRMYLDRNTDGIVFNGSNYSYVSNSNFNLTDYEESVYVEFSTTNKNNVMLYTGSSSERVCIALWSSYIIVSNYGHYSTFTMPDTLDDGNKHSLMTTYKDGDYKLYYDGEALEALSSTDYITSANSNSYFGVRSSGNYFVGQIYKAKIFNKEITPDELNNTENLKVYIDGSNVTFPHDSYESNNYGVNYSIAHSYVAYDLTDVTETKYLYVNTSISSESGDDLGYVQVTDSPDTPTSNSDYWLRVSGTAYDQSLVIKLNSGAVNYVHFRYTKDRDTNVGLDAFIINDVRLFDNISDAYSYNADYYTKIDNMYFEKPVVNEKVDTIEILKDITLDASMTVPAEKEVILDLNGFTLTSNKDDYVIKNNGILTITDSEYKERHLSNVNYITEQARLFEEAKTSYLADKAEYDEYAGLCDGCSPSEEYLIDQSFEKEFDYFGDSEEFSATYTGKYKLETWGAAGAYLESNRHGGYGGYSVGSLDLNAGDKLYVTVGGQGTKENGAPGYNGGAQSGSYGGSGGSGGATHIATAPGVLSSFVDNQSSIIMVSGGGAGYVTYGCSTSIGGSGGGAVGAPSANGGTQTSGGISSGQANGTFGQGASNASNPNCSTAAGGGGYFGGGALCNQCTSGGGSGYIGYSTLYDKAMYCYDCTEATNTETDLDIFTVSTTGTSEYKSNACPNGYSDNPISKCAKAGNGYAKITYLATAEELAELKRDLPKTYNVRKEPIFLDYIQNVDFDDSINVNSLTPYSDVSFTIFGDETFHGGITSTIADVLLNEQYAKLTIDGAAINVNVNSKIGVVNRGLLTMKNDAVINANNSSTTGIFNESNGELVFTRGILNAVGSSSTGLLNRSNTPSINGAIVVTTPSNAIGINNQATSNITYSDLDITGAGLQFQDFSVGDTTITNSSIKSTGNNSFYLPTFQGPGNVYVVNSNFYNTFGINRSPKNVIVSNSTLTYVSNVAGYISINSSSLGSIDNYGDAYINNSTISGSGTLINNQIGSMYSGGAQNVSKMVITDSTINSTATSAVTLINNYHNLSVVNTKFNNVNNVKSTVFNNPMQTFNSSYNYFTPHYPYLNISGNTVIDKSFGTAISNTGVVTIGSNDKNVDTVYNYGYTGHQEEFIAPSDGTYKLETWGAAGAEAHQYASGWDAMRRGGFGAYASGTITLHEGDKLYIHVGGYGSGYGSGTREYSGTYNGGGTIGDGGWSWISGAGGGATDISLSNEDNIWTYDNGRSISMRSNASYEQRLIVAGGGGGQGGSNAGLTVDTSTRLGYGDAMGGGGYYGGTSQQGGSSYVDESLGNRVIIAGYDEMPDYNSGLMNGNTGFGYAKITLLNSDNDIVSNTPTIAATNYGITGNGRVIYYDGTITAKTALNTDIEKVADDYDIYKTMDGEDEVFTLVANANSRPVPDGEEEFVAAIGNAKYTTIQNAVDASNNGDEIDLLVDINQQNIVTIPSNKTITIDYNGHKVITYSDSYLFENNGTLTIKDSVNEKPKNTFFGDKYIYNTGTLNLNNIYIENYIYAQNIIENNEGTITMNDVRLDLGANISGKQGVANSENGVITVTNSVFNLTNANTLFSNYGSLTLTGNNIANNAYGQYMVLNNTTGTAILDGNSYSVSGDSRYGRYLLNNYGSATIKNMTTNIENVYNAGILTLEDNTLPSGNVNTSETGLTIINNGTYNNTFNINGTGRSIDDNDDLYAFIMHDGTLNKTFNTNTTGISWIKSGTITVTSGYAINNTSAGIIRLGIHDNFADTKANTKPVINGKTYGIYTSAPALVVDIYDGIISGNSAYNATVRNTETGYSIIREYDSENNIETKYLTDEPMFKNVTQNIEYKTVNELNTAITNSLVNNNDVIEVYRDITINNADDPITIPNGLSITFDINGKIVDKNNDNMFNVEGELTLVDNVNNSNGIIDSTIGSLFINNGTINISSGKYTSEKASVDTTLMVNNENATLNISGGTFTKYFDKLSYRLRYSGSILTNYGDANITGGKFVPNGSYIIGYTRRWVDEGWYDWDQIYTSTVFLNKETGVLNVTAGATFEGIISNTWHDTYEGGYWEGSGRNNDGQLIYNYGTATFTGTTTSPASIGLNAGTLTFDSVNITGFKQINSQEHPNFKNSGTFNLIDSNIDTSFKFVDNEGGIINISNSTIESNVSISYIINSSTSDTTAVTIEDSEIHNRVSGTIITGATELSIKDSILDTVSGTVVSNSSKGLSINNSTLTTGSGTAVSQTSGTAIIKKNSSVVTSSGVGIQLSSSTLTIGEPISDDSAVSKTYPLIKGTTYGISDSSSTINMYDGIIYGKTNPVANAITNIESGYMIINDTEDDYKTNYLDRVPIVQNITQATAQDEKKYYDLDEAFRNAVDGDTLQMITNYSNLPDSVTAENNHNVIFDLNGFFIRQINDTLITNNGTLKIIDSSQNKTGQIIGISGSKVIDNSGTLNYNGGKISSSALKLLIKNNTGATLNIREDAKIISSIEATIVNNDGTLNIYNGAYLYNIGGSIGSWASSNSGLPMIINNNLFNIIDLNNDDDENTSSDYDAPWLYSNGNAQGQEVFSGADVVFDDPTILTTTGATTNIYGGIFNNGSTTSPNGAQILKNYGTVNIKNLDSYAYAVGLNLGTLNIEDSYLHNFRMTALVSRGNLTIKDTTINFYSDTSYNVLLGNYIRLYSSGNLLFDNVDFIGGNSTNASDYFIYLTGNSEIRNSRINLTSYEKVIYNTNVLDINNSTITMNKSLGNTGKLTVNNSNITANTTVISNTGTFNLKNGSTITATSGNGIDTSGTINIDNGTSINGSEYGIYISGGTANIGEIGNVPDQTTPYIEGSSFGIYRSTQSSNLNFYDGLIIGQTGPNAIYGGVTNVEAGYETEDIIVTDGDIQKHNEYLVVSATSVAVAQVGTYTFASVGSISPSKALQNAINFAIGDGTDVKIVNLVTNVDLINDEVSLTASMPVTVNRNGNNVYYNDVYTVGSNITLNDNGVGGNISRIVADIFDLSYNAKNIVIYELSDGSNLDSLKTYKLYKDGELVSLAKEELGRYSYKGKNEEMTPIKGRLYIDNLSKGSYRLVSNDNKSIEFSIDADGHITGNVAENPKDPGKVNPKSVAKAEVSFAIQTGYSRHLYWILTIPIIVVLFAIMKLSKKRETN